MYFVPGSVQCTSISGNSGDIFFARLNSDVEIPEDFAVFELAKFLNIMSMFDEPSIQIEHNKKLIISDSNRKFEYVLTHPEMIKYPTRPDRYKRPTEGIEFSMGYDKLKEVFKASAILKTNHITFGGDGERLFVSASDYRSPTSSNGKIYLGESDIRFSAVVEKESLKIVDTTYDVVVSRKGFIYLTNSEIEYFIPVNSEFSKLGA